MNFQHIERKFLLVYYASPATPCEACVETVENVENLTTNFDKVEKFIGENFFELKFHYVHAAGYCYFYAIYIGAKEKEKELPDFECSPS